MNSKPIQKRVNNHLFMQEITRAFNSGKKSVTFVVRGFSMRPFLEDGRDKVIWLPSRDRILAYRAHVTVDDRTSQRLTAWEPVTGPSVKPT